MVYDATNRLILCNSRFTPLLDVPPEAVRPGASLSGLVAAHRLDPRLLEHPRPGEQSAVAEAMLDGHTLEV